MMKFRGTEEFEGQIFALANEIKVFLLLDMAFLVETKSISERTLADQYNADDGIQDSYTNEFGRLVIEKKHLVKTDVSLSTINIRIGSLLEGENHIRSIEDEVEIDENNENADLMSHCRHAVGDIVVFDLGEIYADNWLLIAEIVAVTQGGRKFKIKWFWANNYVGSDIMSQPFEEWKQNGETLTGIFKAKKHFCCNFFLENGKLPPEVVRKIRERMINK